MAGWLNLSDNSSVQQCNETKKRQELKLQSCFIELISRFLNGSTNSSCFRPLPPKLGNGHCIDLLKLYFVVKYQGGFEAISEKNLWGEVSLHCGLGPSFGTAFKLIYAKYLISFESWLLKLDKEKSLEFLMELEKEYGAYVPKIMEVKTRSDSSYSFKLEKSGISYFNVTDEDESEKLGWKKLVMDFADSEGSNEGNDEYVASKQHDYGLYGNDEGIIEDDNSDGSLKRVKSEMSFGYGISSDGSDNNRFSASSVVADNVVKSSENSFGSKKCSMEDNGKKMMNVDSEVSKEVSSLKRKRDCFSGMLQWMANVAKDPTDPEVGEIPERSKWASYGNDNRWKQALLARETLFWKKIRVHSAEQFGCQRKPKMHRSLFDLCENLSTNGSYQTETNPARPRQRLEARLDMQPTASIYTNRPQQRIPIGKDFQALVPEWTGVAIESDPKWLGTQTWPLEKSEDRVLIEMDSLGKGRTDDCGCQFPDSTECVKFHVSDRRMKTRFEIGSAFYAWNFDKMGEDCNVSWTIEEEKTFRSIVKENPQSSQKSFWEPMCRALPKKKWADQVNYYYNVFMLRRRGYQNRHYPIDIDSGDDETEYRSTNNSLRHDTA